MSLKIHPLADVRSKSIGLNTRVWQFVVIFENAHIGDDCNICSHCLIENDVVIGDRVTIKSGVQLWDGVSIGSDVFIGPNATFANDRFPRSKHPPEQFLKTVVKNGASIGANASILPGVSIGANSMIGAGAVVTRDVPENAIVIGNPAVIVGYVSTSQTQIRPMAITGNKDKKIATGVGDCQVYVLPEFQDLRGALSFTEFEKDLPFIAKRCFWVFNVPSKEVRGEHAHKQCHQFLVCVAGSVTVLLDDGVSRREVLLDSPSTGLHIAPKVWAVQYRYSKDAVMIVLASHTYDAEDYIRDYKQFLAYTAKVKE